jgi:hypothetical protein
MNEIILAPWDVISKIKQNSSDMNEIILAPCDAGYVQSCTGYIGSAPTQKPPQNPTLLYRHLDYKEQSIKSFFISNCAPDHISGYRLVMSNISLDFSPDFSRLFSTFLDFSRLFTTFLDFSRRRVCCLTFVLFFAALL